MEPDLTALHIVPEIIASTMPETASVKWVLRPTGYLLALAVNPTGGYAELKCHLETHSGEIIPDSEFHVGMAYSSGGIWFKKPLENASSASPYILVIERERDDSPFIPAVTIYPVGCWQK